MMDESYFNGDKRRKYMQMRSLFVQQESAKGEDKICSLIPMARRLYLKYLAKESVSIRFVKAYEDYLRHQDLMEFEEKALDIRFFMTKDEYNMMLKVDVHNGRFMYSNLAYESLDVGAVRYNVYGTSIEVLMRNVLSISDKLGYVEQQRLRSLGILQEAVQVPMREVLSSGQMKIGVDLLRVAERNAQWNAQKILIIGSTSESMGGSKSYSMLDEMYTNSLIYLYDPFEENFSYQTTRGNTIQRIGAKYEYGPDIVNYDVIQDDAFVSFESNRRKIDPDLWLAYAKCFSVKRLQGDDQYFDELNRKRGKHDLVTVQQVGKTDTHERRVMTGIDYVNRYPDVRYGSCSFCKELKQFIHRKHTDKMIEVWAMNHDVHIHCTLRRRYQIPQSNGILEVSGRMVNVALEVDYPVSLPYDVVMDNKVVMNFDMLSTHTYVFSSFSNIMSYMYAAKVAVFKDNLYYVNFEPPVPRQVGGDYMCYGIKFNFNPPIDLLKQVRGSVKVKMKRNKVIREYDFDDSKFLLENEWFNKEGDALIDEKRTVVLAVSLLSYYRRLFLRIEGVGLLVSAPLESY